MSKLHSAIAVPHRIGGLLCLVALFSLGCENTVEPFGREGTFSVYGALIMAEGAPRQFVRVKDLRSPVHADSAGPPARTVTITNLATGASTPLRDSVFGFQGATTHNYTARMHIEPRTRYRLRVEGPHGRRIAATTETPPDREAVIDPARQTPGYPRDTVRADGHALHCLTEFTVIFRNAKFPYRTAVGFNIDGLNRWISQTEKIKTLENGEDGFRFIPHQLLEKYLKDVRDDFDTCRYFENRCKYLASSRIRVRYTYLGPEWFGTRQPSQGGAFDPTQSSRIRGGLGFFGSYLRDTLSVQIHRGVIDQGPDACTDEA